MSNTINPSSSSIHLQTTTGSAGVQATGSFGGSSVQMAAQAQAPAPSSGIGDKIKSFFQAAGDAFKGLGNQIASLFRREAPQAPPAPVIGLGDRGTGQVSNGELRNVYHMIKNEAPNYAATNSTFMRGNTEESKATSSSLSAQARSHFGSNADGFIENFVLQDAGPAFLAANAFIGHDAANQDPQATVDRGLKTFDDFMTLQFGALNDDTSVTEAADRMPQGFCDLLATAHRAVDDLPDTARSRQEKDDMKKAITANFISLRCMTPMLTNQAAELEGDNKKSVIQLSKLVQNACNGIIDTKKEPLHPLAKDAVVQRMGDWHDQVTAFADRLLERGQAAADASSNRLNR